MIECLTRDRWAAGSSFIGVTALCPLGRHINPRLLLVHLRKTRLDITERLLNSNKQTRLPSAIEYAGGGGSEAGEKGYLFSLF